MQIRAIYCILIFSFVCLTSCSSLGKKKKTIVAEIYSQHDYYSADANALKKNNAAEVNRVKALIMNPELLRSSIEKSGFKHSVEEVTKALSFENPENTTIIRIRYSADEMRGASTFLDTLLTNLIYFDIRDDLQKSEKEINYAQFQLDSVASVHEQLKSLPDNDALLAKNQDTYLELLQRKANLSIEKAGIVPKIKILLWAQEEL